MTQTQLRRGPTSTTTTTTPSAEALFAALCAGTLKPAISGDVDRAGLSELSGLVASRSQPGVLWTHNDSGDGSLASTRSTAKARCSPRTCSRV